MIIELYGLPGSGKTTAAQKIKELHGLTPITLGARSEICVFAVRFAMKNPRAFFLTFWYIIMNSHDLKMFYYKVMNVLLYRMAKYEKALEAHMPVLLDEGPFQNILSLFERPLTKEQLLRYAMVLPKPDALVIFNIEQNSRRKLLNSRKRIPRREFGEEYRAQWEKAMEENDKIFRGFTSELPLRCIFVEELDALPDVEHILNTRQ